MGFKFNATTGLLDIAGLTSADTDALYIRKDGTSTTTARIPFAVGWSAASTSLMSGTSALFFGSSSGANTGKISWDSSGNGSLTIGTFNTTGAKAPASNVLIRAQEGNAPSGQSRDGGVVYLRGNWGSGLTFIHGYVGIGDTAYPSLLTPSFDGNDLIVSGQLEVQDNVYLTVLSDGILKATSGLVENALAGTDYENPLTFSSPLSRSVNTVSFLFNTNNTWTGTNKINVNSTTAFFVEQDGVKDNIFIVDTTNGNVSINQAIDTTATLALTITETTLNPARLFTIRTIQTYSDRANCAAINSLITLNKTTGNGSNVNGMVFVINDNSVSTTGTGNSVQGVNLTVARSSTFSTTRTTDNLRMFYLQATDSGNYNATTNCTANSYGNFISMTFSPTQNPASGTPTLTYSGFGTDVQITGTPVNTAGTLVYNIYGIRVNMTGGTAGTSTGYAYHVQGVSGYDNNYAYYNSTAVSNLMGIDNGKSYFGTGLDVFIQYTGTVWDFDIALATTEIVFNNSGFDTDFRVESDTDANCFFVDAGNNRVGIGMNNPAYKLDVAGDANVSGVYRVGGTAGFTGTGAYTNFTIVGGIITNAT